MKSICTKSPKFGWKLANFWTNFTHPEFIDKIKVVRVITIYSTSSERRRRSGKGTISVLLVYISLFTIHIIPFLFEGFWSVLVFAPEQFNTTQYDNWVPNTLSASPLFIIGILHSWITAIAVFFDSFIQLTSLNPFRLFYLGVLEICWFILWLSSHSLFSMGNHPLSTLVISPCVPAQPN